MAAEATDWSYSGLRAKAGLGIAEYIFILAGIASLIIVALKFTQPQISSTLNQVTGCYYPNTVMSLLLCEEQPAYGTVTSVSGSSYTVSLIGITYTFTVTSSMTDANPNATATSASAVKVGTCVEVRAVPSQYGHIVVDSVRIYSYGACPLNRP